MSNVPIRPASTVVVLRESAAAREPFDILMVRRSDKVAFMAGAYVFPGGRVDEGDYPAPHAELRAPLFSDLSARDEMAFRTAAVRELREEANVVLSEDDLHPFAHWVTPDIEIRRYDTRFFLARMPFGQDPRHDQSETTALDWMSPREAIARFERRELMMPPPTWTTIRQLQKRTSIEDALAWAASRQIVRVMPGFFKDGDQMTLTLPGDPTYPVMPGWDPPDETRFILEDGARWRPLKP